MACGTIHFGAKKIKSKSKFLGINIKEVCLLILSILNNATRSGASLCVAPDIVTVGCANGIRKCYGVDASALECWATMGLLPNLRFTQPCNAVSPVGRARFFALRPTL